MKLLLVFPILQLHTTKYCLIGVSQFCFFLMDFNLVLVFAPPLLRFFSPNLPFCVHQPVDKWVSCAVNSIVKFELLCIHFLLLNVEIIS